MDNYEFKSYLIEDKSFVSFVKREIHHLVSPAFSAQRTGEINIVVAELTSNIVKYAGGGELLYRLSYSNDSPLFELICLDNGPGIENVSHLTRDGISTSTSLGHGMGSIQRLSDVAQVYSMEKWGTVVYCRFTKNPEVKEKRQKVIIRNLTVPKPGETVSGDGISFKVDGIRTVVMAGDGLGHGIKAHEAVKTVIDTFQKSSSTDPSELIREFDRSARKTRGLVASVAVFDEGKKRWELCGVGNISTKLYHGLEYKNYVCNNGIIGMNMPNRIDNAYIDMEKFQQLILCSDGIRMKWDLIRYPAVLKYDPMILAAVIYKDHARRTDDMTVLIARVT